MTEEKEIIDAMCIGAIIAELGDFPEPEARKVAEVSSHQRSAAYMHIFFYMESVLAELRRQGYEVTKKKIEH